MSRPNTDQLRRMILDHFGEERPPMLPGEIVPLGEYDDDYVRERFAGRDWRELATIEELESTDSALSFFTRNAFVYFLPAFMIASLDDLERADLIPSSIEFRLERDPGIRQLLSIEQIAVLEQFLRFCLEDEDSDFEEA